MPDIPVPENHHARTPIVSGEYGVAKTQVAFLIADNAVVSVNAHRQTTMLSTSCKKGKVKCMTFPFEAQSSIDDGQPRKESRKRQQLRKKEK